MDSLSVDQGSFIIIKIIIIINVYFIIINQDSIEIIENIIIINIYFTINFLSNLCL